MHKSFLVFLVCLCLNVSAQPFKTYLTSQAWAGGQCCHSGIDYVLTITGNPAELEKLNVKAICIDGFHFDQFQVSAVATNGKMASRTWRFSLNTSKEYMPAFQEKEFTPCPNPGRIYLEGKEFLMVESYTELPYIPYP
jgi:hypothetical protein